MKIAVLHIDECPNHIETTRRVREVLDAAGHSDVEIDDVLISTPEDAERTGFAGSPTILADGADLFPSEGRTNDLACRIYFTPEGLAGQPTVEQLADALTSRG